jgi:ABC-type transporter Mla MlaB component
VLVPVRIEVRCDVSALERVDLCTIDTLARLSLACRRSGRDLQLTGASAALRALVSFVGLTDVLPCVPDTGPESQGRSGSPNIGK